MFTAHFDFKGFTDSNINLSQVTYVIMCDQWFEVHVDQIESDDSG